MKKKRGFCFGKKAEDIVQQTGQKIKLAYCPHVKGPNVRGINSLVAHDIDCTIQSLVGMRASMFYDLDQTEKWKVWNAMSEGSSGMPSDFIGREDQWEFLCQHFESDAFKRLSLANKRNCGEKTMHHHKGSSPIIYTVEELRIQGEQLPIIKGFEKTYVRAGDENTTKKYVNVFPFTLCKLSK
ncbi:hypothetical protein ACLB2K_022125 [Fragaria x ananassa]